MGPCTDNKAGMNSIYDLSDGMHGPNARLYLPNKYYKYVSGTVLNPDTLPPDSRNSDKCDKAVREAVVCKQVVEDGMRPSEKSLDVPYFCGIFIMNPSETGLM